MSRIQTNIGLISGINITDIVNQLMAVEARPREILVERNKAVTTQQTALNDVLARLLTVEFSAKRLKDIKLYQQRTVTSSNTAALVATVSGDAQIGTGQFTPLQVAQTHQLISSGFASDTAAIGAGTFTIRFGGAVDAGLDVAVLNGGAGLSPGKIRITDRSGASAEVDLRFARTVDDVLRAINETSGIQVKAEVHGDRFRLVDSTGQTTANLRVQEVNQGTTAASLGLAGIDVAASQIDGADVVRLYNGLNLNYLNDGNGVRFAAGDDLRISFRDGTTLDIDLGGQQTLGEVLTALNAADPARLQASIAAGGDRLLLTDLTVDDGGTFAVEALGGSLAAYDLGLLRGAVDDELSGGRLLAGLKSTLLTSLAGGRGITGLGSVELTDRGGASQTVDLSTAETLDDVLDLLNASGLGIRAEINAAHNGIVLVDTTGQTASNLIVANADGTESATRLKLAVDAASDRHDGGSLDRKFISENTRLATLNGGSGIPLGSFTIFDKRAAGETINITAADVTVADVLKKLNDTDLEIEARINDTGDGILVVSTGTGGNALRVFDGATKTGAALRLTGAEKTIDINGTPTKVLNGSTSLHVTLSDTDTLKDLAKKINDAGVGVSASTYSDGSGISPYRLRLTSQHSGHAGALRVDTSGVGFTVAETSRAQDALLLVGSPESGTLGQIAASSTGTFQGLMPGVTLTVAAVATAPVTVTVTGTDTNLVATLTALVDSYNNLVTKIKEYTKYNAETDVSGILRGDGAVLRVESEMSRLLSGRFAGTGTLRSIEQLGIKLKGDGTLEFDSAAFKTLFAADPQAVQDFLAKADAGMADKLSRVTEQLGGERNSLLVNRTLALQRRIEINDQRIEVFDVRLERKRERLLKQFYNLELALAKIQNAQTAISQIQILKPLTQVER